MKKFKSYFKKVNTQIAESETQVKCSAQNIEADHIPSNADLSDTADTADTADTTDTVDTYKIISTTSKDVAPFLVYDNDRSTLNSKSLFRLADLDTDSSNFLANLLNIEDQNENIWMDSIGRCGAILKETTAFSDFDPYCNFLLSCECKDANREIRHIIKCTTSDMIESSLFDYALLQNPYGLEHVVFTGGGSKGTIYIGAILGLLATGQIFYLNNFAGTSIGGLSAMFLACITPDKDTYHRISRQTLKQISQDTELIDLYRAAVRFCTIRTAKRDIDTFFEKPNMSFYGMWNIASKIMQHNGLYNPEKTGFQVWQSLIVMRICTIMRNGLDSKIIILDDKGCVIRFGSDTADATNTNTNTKYRTIQDADIDTLSFVGWTIRSFFTFEEYNELTSKTIVFAGTETDPVDSVYYTHNLKYRHMRVIDGARASMSIPWVMEAPIIGGSYHLDGGIYNNYPLTHLDRTIKGKVKYYSNKVFGYLIDDQNSIIDAYEVMRELWLVYGGFLQIMNIGHLASVPNFDELSLLFFEIRQEVYKMLYYADTEIRTFLEGYLPTSASTTTTTTTIPDLVSDTLGMDEHEVERYNVAGLARVFTIIVEHMKESPYLKFGLPLKGVDYVVRCLNSLASHAVHTAGISETEPEPVFKIGNLTDIADILNLAISQGIIYNELIDLIRSDLAEIQKLDDGSDMRIIRRYKKILLHLMTHILAYYEVKGTFIRTNDLDQPCNYFVVLLKKLGDKLSRFDKMVRLADIACKNKAGSAITHTHIHIHTDDSTRTPDLRPSIDIGLAMISKIVKRGSSSSSNPHAHTDEANGKTIQTAQTAQAIQAIQTIQTIQSIQTIESAQPSSAYSYKKVVDYFFHTDMAGIFYKYMCIANDRICTDMFNRMRTIKVNTFETNVLHFGMDRELKSRLIYEGYSKTIKYFTNILRIMELTQMSRVSDFIPSYEVLYKSVMHK